MKIGVMSDTHGSLKYFEKALDVLKDCDYILHGGDILYHGPRNPLPDGYSPMDLSKKINTLNNIIFTCGNCDSDVDQMVITHPIQTPYVFLELGKFRMFMCHGYKKEKEEFIQMAKNFKSNIFISGHTHIKELYKDGDLIVLNPGSTSIPKDDSHSVAIIEDTYISLIDINTLETIKTLSI
ncbi:phosphodiesterase [Alkalithermobacter paradoxus]|uniref:Phosphoesterase n=1 Tax=Alkalithermobacter paradoxus TaxID=29349 RepID=A0A1V4I981_9FIRM|nr:phosphodiesterase YfcE [[Clostridium] thermoalcaliphilum]